MSKGTHQLHRNHVRGIISVVAVLVILLGIGLRLRVALPTHAAGEAVNVWLTTSDLSNHLTPQAPLTFAAGGGAASTNITVDESQQFQQMTGFGAAMTDSSASLIENNLSADQRNTLMQNLFSANAGIGVNFIRVPMAATDFITTPTSYSYDDEPSGQTDPSLANFSINHDLPYIVPALQQVLQIQPQAQILATPWSPPGWMKDSGTMLGGSCSHTHMGRWRTIS